MTCEENPFLRAATALISGAVGAREVWGVLLREAGEDLLFQVAKKHGVPYEALIVHLPPLLELYTRLDTDAECSAVTSRGRQCRKRAAVNGLCQQHAAAEADDRSKKRRTNAYLTQRSATSTHLLMARCTEPEIPVPGVAPADLRDLLS